MTNTTPTTIETPLRYRHGNDELHIVADNLEGCTDVVVTWDRPTRPLGLECGDTVWVITDDGSFYMGIVTDYHDCWLIGGFPTFVAIDLI